MRSDIINVAKNLGRILDRMEAKGWKRSQLLRDLNMGKNIDSTKQLYTYELPADATGETHTKRIGKLTKTCGLYARIAEGAAKAMGEDADLIVLHLFDGTGYQVADDASDETIASMEHIRDLLVGMADGAMRRNDMAKYLDILNEGKVGWDIDGSFGNFAPLPIGVHFRDRAARHVSYLGCAPTVLLYRTHAGPEEPIGGEAFQIDFAEDPDAVENFLFKGRALPKKHRVPVALSINREIWFGLAPMEEGWSWKPVFEKRLSFDVRGRDSGRRSISLSTYDPTILYELRRWAREEPPHRLLWLHQYTLLPHKPEGASLEFCVSPHIDTSELIGSHDIKRPHLEDRWLVALTPFDGASLSVDDDIEGGKGQFFYETVDLASCAKYLDVVARKPKSELTN